MRATTALQLALEATGEHDWGPCSHCGEMRRRVWGFVHRGDATEAAYFVEWTPGGGTKHGTYFDLIIGRWGDGSSRSDRVAVSLEFRRESGRPQFMVIDATNRNVGTSDVVGRALARTEVLDTPIAARAYAVVDAVWLQDERIGEITVDAP